MGLMSLVWFLVRVIPKPSRASYPCQRAAFPVASSFVVWIAALLGSAFSLRKLRLPRQRFWKACVWGAGALASCALIVASLPMARTFAGDNPSHGPLGVAKGVCPGRVAWVHAPDAVNWGGLYSAEHWYASNHCDLATVEIMMSKAIQSVGGTNSDKAAWDAIFMYFNRAHGKGTRGYQPGEKVAIKVNLTTCYASGCTPTTSAATVDTLGTYEKYDVIWGTTDPSSWAYHWRNSIDPAPQVILSLLRHLVYTVGVAQTNISIGDPTAIFPKYLWDQLHPEFPNVVYFDYLGRQGRVRCDLSSTPFYWSYTNQAQPGQPLAQDYVPVPFAQADYIISAATLKTHSRAGITCNAKNFYGALLRTPPGAFRDAGGLFVSGNLNYNNLHAALPEAGANNDYAGTAGLGHYRALVDLLGSPRLGGKLLIGVVDGLFAGVDWAGTPQPWTLPPFNTNWPASIFVSQDPVALDSVCYDFLLAEYPSLVNVPTMGGGAEDYLHEAALANNPPSGIFYDPGKTGTRLQSLGVHEHWDNSTNKLYSRNIDPVNGTGIELVALRASRDAVLSVAQTPGHVVLSWLASLGYGLQTTTNLGGSNSWSTVSPLPAPYQARNNYTNTVSDPRRFYRLVR